MLWITAAPWPGRIGRSAVGLPSFFRYRCRCCIAPPVRPAAAGPPKYGAVTPAAQHPRRHHQGSKRPFSYQEYNRLVVARQREGVPCGVLLTVLEAGTAEQSISDDEFLAFATAEPL